MLDRFGPPRSSYRGPPAHRYRRPPPAASPTLPRGRRKLTGSRRTASSFFDHAGVNGVVDQAAAARWALTVATTYAGRRSTSCQVNRTSRQPTSAFVRQRST